MSLQKKIEGSKKNFDPKIDNGSDDKPMALAENLYKKNIELVTTNKTLSLLSKLYEISILTLEPKELALRVSRTVQVDLSFELVGIFTFDEKADSLVPLAFSKSERIAASLKSLGLALEDLSILSATPRPFFKETLSLKKTNMTDNIGEVWGDLIGDENLQTVTSEAHIKATLLLPLIVESKLLGVIIFALNRDYVTLSAFEKDSIKSLVNVIAVALEKAYLYKELENANAKLRDLDHQKDAVLHMVAHQFKGPITTTNYITELLLDGTYGSLTEEQRENINNIRSATRSMRDQSEMVLAAAQITLGKKLPIEPIPLDLNIFFKDVMTGAMIQAKSRKVELKASIPPRLPTVMLDRKFTQIAVDNLLSNALKYTALKSPDGGGTVDFTIVIKENVLHCIVKDTGVGVPEQDKDQIFKELSRASNAGKEGTGLGLHVAKGAIESQGGKMWFESTEGKGTTFYFDLPLKEAPAKS